MNPIQQLVRQPVLIAGVALLLLATATSAGAADPVESTEDASRYDCLIEPMVVTKVGSQVQGIIQRLLVDRSDFVKVGQPIAELNASIEQANLEQAQARAQMQSEIRARTADLSLAIHNMERMQKLFEKNMVPAQQKDETQAQLLVATAALTQAKENHRLLQHELARAEKLVAQRTIHSPVDGVVVEQSAFAGEFVYENPVMTIAQLDPLRVEVVLPGRLFNHFKPGDQALVYPELSDEPLDAEVDVVDRLLDTRSGTFGVRLTLPNPEFMITGGQKCRMEFDKPAQLARQ